MSARQQFLALGSSSTLQRHCIMSHHVATNLLLCYISHLNLRQHTADRVRDSIATSLVLDDWLANPAAPHTVLAHEARLVVLFLLLLLRKQVDRHIWFRDK
jgi:hypothetical protein